MHQLQVVGDLIDIIYRGATDAQAWPKVVSRTAAWLNAPKALLFTPLITPDEGGFLLPYGLSESAQATWAQSKRCVDLWSQRAIARGLATEGNIVVDSDLATEDELRNSPWYIEFLQTQSIARLMSGIVFGIESNSRMLTGLSLYRDWSEPSFGQEDRRRLGLLIPHISRAMGLMMTLRDNELRVACTQEALNRLSTGIVLLAADESLVFANRAAEQIFRQADGLSLKAVDGRGKHRLSVWNDEARLAIQTGLRAVLGRSLQVSHFSQQKIVVSRRSGKTHYTVQLSAFPGSCSYGTSSVRAIALVCDPERKIQINPASLQLAFALTPAEARVAASLFDGNELATVAGQLQVQASTVRTHLRRIYEKVGVQSRAGLMKVLLCHAEP